ncbi:hypothetical protein L198_02668 [Cryptococcus wingfieldii CBS 7118]|uniref:Clathrin/coatomer adaptor adaptin-like N-terminal domain-containing protein n=1 Tax=Cryptococcus wingfieldii CBS 7118 TaxID=1295528 RepID=A0A1E3JM50_9TREE|nr:hypothetical protein L198_02668 [Cryptococcus wingfieldii CBS 7118]ODO01938.1 hypothetical protein L198_02668 [Cryptococcus wingfieldii CBS 7118]
MSTPSLPPYLTSGASSRTHHALLARLNQAASPHEEDAIISEHLSHAKTLFRSQDQNASRVAETLITVLHCTALRHDCSDDLEFVLIPALKLAEGGKSVQEKRIGYLYLTENLPRDHELHLLLINTIRKDLSSTKEAHVLLALQAIVKLSSRDLGPAVTPILISRALIRHHLPSIRQRVYESLRSLYLLSPNAAHEPEPFPLTMSKLVKALGQETDSGVYTAILRLLGGLVQRNIQTVTTDAEQQYIIQLVLDRIAERQVLLEGQMSLQALSLFLTLFKKRPLVSENEVTDELSTWLSNIIQPISNGWQGGTSPLLTHCWLDTYQYTAAFLIESCRLASHLPKIAPACVHSATQLLYQPSPSSHGHLTPQTPSPNDHILALRCLMLLPRESWDGKLGEGEMGVIMEGVNSVDTSVRRSTIRLLESLSPDLPRSIFQRYLESLKSNSDLSLPMNIPADHPLASKVDLARRETARRALEVLEVTSAEDGEVYGENVANLLLIFEGGQNEGTIWEELLRGVMEFIVSKDDGKLIHPFSFSFLSKLSAAKPENSGPTTVTIASTLACSHLPSNARPTAFSYLLRVLPQVPPSIQELVLGALTTYMMGEHDKAEDQEVVSAVREVEETAPRYLQKVSYLLLHARSQEY